MNSKRVRISRASIRHCPQLAAVISIVLLTASFSLAQTKNPRTAKGEVISPDRYIVRLRDDIKDPAAVSRDLARRHGFVVGHVYRRVLRGFSARMSRAVMHNLERNAEVEYIEPDRKYYAIGQTLPTGVDRMDAGPEFTDGGVNVEVDIAIIDTGIDLDHPDLNVMGSTNCARFGGCLDGGGNDGYGHGTHVAGIAAAKDNGIGVVGVAPGARLWAVRVLDNNGSGWTSWIIAGIDWVTEHAATIEVANMSLGGQGFSTAMREAIRQSVEAGVVYTVAAGNNARDIYGPDGRFGTSDDFVPAAYPEVAAISAFADSDGSSGGAGADTSYGADDSFASFSNYSRSVTDGNPVTSPGAAIDLMCPGVDIYSTYLNGQYATFSGTSMASPHAAGLAALYIAQKGRPENPDEFYVYAVRQALIDAGIDQDEAGGLDELNDPDDNPEPLGYAEPVAEITDLSLAAIEAPDSVVVGDTVNITVTVRNVGAFNVDSSFKVSLEVEDVVTIDSEPINGLAAGQSVDRTFEWDTVELPIGSYTLTATLVFPEDFVDDNSSNNTKTVEVEVRDQSLPTTIHIGDLDGSSRNVFWSIWAATVTITVHDTDHNPVPVATVYGVFSDGSSGFQCTTGANGRCSVQGYQWLQNSLIFTVTDVYQVDLDYEPADNHDPDGDSNGTSITVSRP